MTRTNATCPFCKRREAVFVASSGNGNALYRCMNRLRRNACGKWFELEHPKPLVPAWLQQMIEGRAA